MDVTTDGSLFSPADWRRRLQLVTDAARDMSRRDTATDILSACQTRRRDWLPVDGILTVSRRGLQRPGFRITAGDPWLTLTSSSNAALEGAILEGGLLGELVHAGHATTIEELAADPHDPAFEHLRGMGSLAAVPHFDDGQSAEMVIYLRRASHAFPPEHLPELVLLVNLFGRALRESAVVQQLRDADVRLREEYNAVSSLSDTVLEQALSLKHHTRDLEEKVRERTADLENAQLDTIFMLALASEAKDEDTGLHLRRIEQSSRLVAVELGLDAREAETLGRAAVLHDVGKMHVPDRILKKPGPLTQDEREIMRQHTIAAERILLDRPYFSTARSIARSHHENWDGTGYPDRLQRDAIPLEARIVHLVDVYDALTSVRVYKPAWTADEALRLIKSSAGTQFDPSVVRAFLHLHARGEFPNGTTSLDIAATPS
jgi:response regulator RpfG family c-di-GMP phosphodiesterase